MTLDTNNRHVSGRCWQGFQGQRSQVKVKVIALAAEVYISTAWRRDSFVCLLVDDDDDD